MKIDDEILQKVTMFSNIIASDAFLLLPNELPSQKPGQINQGESIHEIIAAQISKSVFSHIKAFKNTKRADKKEKDTNIGEMTMYFLYRLHDFENKYMSTLNQDNILAKPIDGKMSILLSDEIPAAVQDRSLAESFKSDVNFRQDEDTPLWAGLTNNYDIIEVEEEEEDGPSFVKDQLGSKISNHRSNF